MNDKMSHTLQNNGSSFRKSPSTSARLEEALSQIRARDKYRAQTRSPSDGEDLRWYFSKARLSLNEAAISVPAAEVVGKSDFLRFSINDSLALEMAFLEQEEEFVSAWWKEYAEYSEGPIGVAGKALMKLDADTFVKGADIEVNRVGGSSSCSGAPVSSFKQQNGSEPYDYDEVIGVPVKGGLYEVDLFQRRCYPVYWTGDHRRVLRGHWFAQKGGLDWLPLREDISEQLEIAYRSQIWHRRTFQPSGKFAARVNLQSGTQGLHALFTGEDDTWEAWLAVDTSGISSVLGLRGSGIKLRRGFSPSQSPQPTQDELRQRKEEEMDDYCSQVPVHHLVFMVHGIGQRLEKANLVDDVGTFRRTALSLAEQHLTNYQRNSQRVLFIPCQWRRGLKLGGEEAVENCTLEGVRALRTMLSATVHDVLYYMSPVYCQDIIDSVSWQLNRLYCKFMKRNPGYEGKVSIYGHSLGSVLSYDILCHQKNLFSMLPINQVDENIQNIEVSSRHACEKNENDAGVDKEHMPEKDNGFVHCEDTAFKSLEHETNKEEIDILRDEVIRLKAKLTALEEGHHDIKQDFIARKEPSGSGDGNLIPQDVPEGEFRPLEIAHERNNSCDSEENKLVPAKPDEKPQDFAGEVSMLDTGSSKFPVTAQNGSKKADLKTRWSSRKRYTPYIEYTKLSFKIDTFFAVGSPLGVFLALRNVRLGNGMGKEYWQDDGIDEEMPACRRMFNIFHPFDPVAYRIEPLVCKEYVNKRPVFVPYHRGGKRLHIGMQEFGADISARSKAFVHSLGMVGDRVANVFSASSTEKDDEHDANEQKEQTYGELIMERLTGEPYGRIDYMLQDATFEHQYLQAISSHTAYWQDPDTVLFIVKHLYRDIPEKCPKPKTEVESEISEETIPIEPSPLLEQNDVADDDIAFTFSNKEKGSVGGFVTTKQVYDAVEEVPDIC